MPARHDDAVARIEHRQETEHEGSGRPYGDHHLPGSERSRSCGGSARRSRRAARGGQGPRCSRPIRRPGAARGIEHARGRAASGLADLQMDDLAPRHSLRVGARQHIHGDERCDLAARRDLERPGQRTGSHRFVNVHICSQVLSQPGRHRQTPAGGTCWMRTMGTPEQGGKGQVDVRHAFRSGLALALGAMLGLLPYGPRAPRRSV